MVRTMVCTRVCVYVRTYVRTYVHVYLVLSTMVRVPLVDSRVIGNVRLLEYVCTTRVRTNITTVSQKQLEIQALRLSSTYCNTCVLYVRTYTYTDLLIKMLCHNFLIGKGHTCMCTDEKEPRTRVVPWYSIRTVHVCVYVRTRVRTKWYTSTRIPCGTMVVLEYHGNWYYTCTMEYQWYVLWITNHGTWYGVSVHVCCKYRLVRTYIHVYVQCTTITLSQKRW
jgi:hypothetical protein